MALQLALAPALPLTQQIAEAHLHARRRHLGVSSAVDARLSITRQ
jgi:hypothetical protein